MRIASYQEVYPSYTKAFNQALVNSVAILHTNQRMHTQVKGVDKGGGGLGGCSINVFFTQTNNNQLAVGCQTLPCSSPCQL